MGRLDGRVAIVTGGGNGMGEAVARNLAAEGAKVVVSDIGVWNQGGIPDAQRVANDIIAAGGTAVYDTSDMSLFSGGEQVVKTAIDNFGKIDILCLIAGCIITGKVDEMTEAQFDKNINVNLKQCFNVCHHAVKYMKEAKYGRILVYASRGAFGSPDAPSQSCGYSAGKAGAVGFCSELAIELAPYGDFRVNCVMPAAASKLFPNERKAAYSGVPSPWPSTPDMPAPMTTYLCLEECPCTGELFYIAGTDVGLYPRDRKVLGYMHKGNYEKWTLDELCEQVPSAFGWYFETRPKTSNYDVTAGQDRSK